MTSTVEYGTYIIDLCAAMLDNPAGLNKDQTRRIGMMRKATIAFLTDYLRHESSSLPDLLQYLTKEAVSPLRTLIGCCDIILDGGHGSIGNDYGDAIVEIRDCGYAMYDDVEDMRQNLGQLMADLGTVN